MRMYAAESYVKWVGEWALSGVVSALIFGLTWNMCLVAFGSRNVLQGGQLYIASGEQAISLASCIVTSVAAGMDALFILSRSGSGRRALGDQVRRALLIVGYWLTWLVLVGIVFRIMQYSALQIWGKQNVLFGGLYLPTEKANNLKVTVFLFIPLLIVVTRQCKQDAQSIFLRRLGSVDER